MPSQERWFLAVRHSVDKVICFAPLQGTALEKIAGKYLSQLQERAASAGIQLQFPAELATALGAESIRQGGARQLRHLVQERIEAPLSVYLLRASRQPTKVRGVMEAGQLQFLP